MTDKDKREGWLRELKVGDEVVISCQSNSQIVPVEKITPGGRITAGRNNFNCRGTEIGGSRWNTWHLRELTDERRAIMVTNAARRYLNHLTWDMIPADIVMQVRQILHDREPEASK